MNRLFLALIAFTAFSCSSPEEQEGRGPNIIFIMSDDHANRAISAYGSDLIQTPNLDRLANEGMLFSNSFVTNSICGPSRAVMLTGKFSHLNGFMDNSSVFDGSQQTFPKLLQKAGYETAIVGKWHLKSTPTGFDYWDVLPGQGDYFNPDFINEEGRYNVAGYVTDIITNKALDWLQKRDDEKPFSLLVHHKAPHRNWMPDTTYLDMYKNEDLPVPETFFDNYRTRETTAGTQEMSVDRHMSPNYDLMMPSEEEYGWTVGYNEKQLEKMSPEFRERWQRHYDEENAKFAAMNLEGRELAEYKYQRYIKNYLRCIASVDDNIGRLLDYLDESGLSENTIVVYTSDQGFYLGEHGWYDKRWMYEQSLSMPLMIRYPGAGNAGAVADQMVQNIDFAPTFLDIAGVEIPDDMQGRSLKPILEGKDPGEWRDDIYYHYYEYPGVHAVKRHYGVRDQRYKLFHSYYDVDTWEMYDLEKDPDELTNIYDDPAYQEIRVGLEKRLLELQKEYAEADPALWKSPDPIRVENLAKGAQISLSVEPKRKQVEDYAAILVDGNKWKESPYWGSDWRPFLGFDEPVTVTIDLNESVEVGVVEVSSFFKTGSWIHPPQSVTISTSIDGVEYKAVGQAVKSQADGSIAAVSLEATVGSLIRYVKVDLTPTVSIPDQYPGAGNSAWMFIDEIIVR